MAADTVKNSPSTLRDYTTTIMILESISDAIFILNHSRAIEYANKSALDLIQASLPDLSGRDFNSLLYSSDSLNSSLSSANGESPAAEPANAEPGISELQGKGFIDDIEKGLLGNIELNIRSGPSVIPVLLNFSLISDPGGQPRYIIVTAKDIRDWKSMERDLQHQQIISIFQERQRVLGELFEGLLHSLSQPLVTLQMRLDLIEKYKLSEDGGPKTDAAHREIAQLVSSMNETIETVRAFTRQSNTRHIVEIDVRDTVLSIQRLLSYEYQKRKIRLEIRENGALPPVRTNPMLLQQVFLNILKNSQDAFADPAFPVTYSTDYPRTIVVHLSARADKWLEITFADNAGGMNDEVQKQLFEPFFTSRSDQLHSGVGLSMAHSIISSLGGDISLDVEQGHGSAFTVRIPVTQNEEQDQLHNLIELLNRK